MYGCPNMVGPVYDHYGRLFPNVETMCRWWRISPSTYRARLAAGWELGVALETPIRRHNRNRNYRYVRLPGGRRVKVR